MARSTMTPILSILVLLLVLGGVALPAVATSDPDLQAISGYKSWKRVMPKVLQGADINALAVSPAG